MTSTEPPSWLSELLGAIGLTALFDEYRRLCLGNGIQMLDRMHWLIYPTAIFIRAPMFIRALQAGVEFTYPPAEPRSFKAARPLTLVK
jgi:hypothetical protein